MADSMPATLDLRRAFAPARRAHGAAATPQSLAFGQHIAAFYPYPNPQQPAAAAADTAAEGRAAAPAGKAAGLMKRRHGRGSS